MPVPTNGLKVISIGMMKPRRDQVVAWRGPILDRALTQMLADVYWGDLDFLLLDLPPGTGDVAISLGQKLPNAEVVVVTTPQQAAAEVAERAGTMASMMNQRVVGVVENMSYLQVALPALRHRPPLRRVRQRWRRRGGGQPEHPARLPRPPVGPGAAGPEAARRRRRRSPDRGRETRTPPPPRHSPVWPTSWPGAAATWPASSSASRRSAAEARLPICRPTGPPAPFFQLTVDCRDPERLADFWAAALGWSRTAAGHTEHLVVGLLPPTSGRGLRLRRSPLRPRRSPPPDLVPTGSGTQISQEPPPPRPLPHRPRHHPGRTRTSIRGRIHRRRPPRPRRHRPLPHRRTRRLLDHPRRPRRQRILRQLTREAATTRTPTREHEPRAKTREQTDVGNC